jgi:hypothetical protein
MKSRRIRWSGQVARMGKMKMHTVFWSENLKGRDHSEDLGVDERLIIIDVRKIRLECVDWIHLAQDWDQWRTLVNTVMSLWVP